MSEQDTDAINSGDELDHDRDGSQTHTNVNRREARYKIRDRSRERQSQWKGALTATRSIGKSVHKVFSTIVKDISKELSPLGEYGSEVSHFIIEPRNFSEVTKLSENIKKPWLKANLKGIKNIINNQNILIEDQNEGGPVTTCMDVYKAKIQSNGILDKLKLRIVVRGYLQNKEMVGDTWSPTASMSNMKCFLADAAKHLVAPNS